MPTTSSHRRLRSAAVTAALLTAALAAPAGALASGPPTLGPATIIAAGQRSPVDMGGNRLRQGDTIARGTQLMRWAVTMHGVSKVPVTLACPASTVESGWGTQEGSQVYPGSAAGDRFYERTIDVTFRAAPKVDPGTAHGQVYLLCRDTKVAPLGPELLEPTPPLAVRTAGQRSPVAVPAAHMRRGATIAKGAQLVRWGVALFDAKEHVLTLTCPHGTVMRGIGTQKGSQIAGRALSSGYGHNTLKVGFRRTSNAHYNDATASVYTLCSSR